MGATVFKRPAFPTAVGPILTPEHATFVPMGRMAAGATPLFTAGLSTCTAVAVVGSGGVFLAHVASVADGVQPTVEDMVAEVRTLGELSYFGVFPGAAWRTERRALAALS